VLTKVTDIIAELLAGKLDGAFIETAVAENYAISYPDRRSSMTSLRR
jgi:polar amino acid transport system substrate-binding protein